MITHLFVYGTLRPGDVRWHLLSPHVVDEGAADTVAGSVYDTGLDYPAAMFGSSTGEPARSISGRTYALRESSVEECLRVLDHEENTVGGDYRRVSIRTSNGTSAWAYEYGEGLELTLIESGDWFQR